MFLLFRFKDDTSKDNNEIATAVFLQGNYDTEEEARFAAIGTADLILYTNEQLHNNDDIYFTAPLLKELKIYFKIVNFSNKDTYLGTFVSEV